MGLLSYLRGDDLLEDSATQPKDESRYLPPAQNQLPLMGAYTSWTVTPTAALTITARGAAVRLTRVAPVSGGNRPVASTAGPCLGGRHG
jgi:hypothetical protein